MLKQLMKMKNEQVLLTKELRMRLIDLEYKYNRDSSKMTEEIFIQEVERIYLEETGQQLSADISVFTSSESKKLQNDNSGYDGTALHFYSEENNINEVYVISQGTQDLDDWLYNIEAMMAGKSIDQAEATHDFTIEALEEFNIAVDKNNMSKIEVPVVGLSHSLSHNNNTTAYLINDTFSKVYSVNGAQTNYYQLFREDPKFNKVLRSKYPELKIDPDFIYDLPPDDIKKIAEEFYADKAGNIYQDISLQDPLYAVSGTRGFFELGHVEYHETSDAHNGLRKMVDKIPDDVVAALQKLAIDFTVSNEDGSMKEVLQDLTGVDMDVIEKFDGVWGSIKTYLGDEFTEMIPDVNAKLPGLIKNIQLITGNSETIFAELYRANYITQAQKEELIAVFNDIENELLIIQKAFADLEAYRHDGEGNIFSKDFTSGYNLYQSIMNRLPALFEILNKDEYKKILEMIVDSHGISEMISTLGGKNKNYLNGDLLMAPTSGGGGSDIWVNISAALRMYTEGKVVMEKRKNEINRLENTIEETIVDHFENEKQRLLKKIDDLEENPSHYRSMVQQHVNETIKGVERIAVYDHINPIPKINQDAFVELQKQLVTDGLHFIEKNRKAIEDMFDEEARVAELFDLAELIIDGN